ncbi:MAG: gamma-glutamylcyclotransferase family protein [Actinomycetota bacterium]
MTYYFAYGSNMDPLQMERRCPGARAIGPARLDDHRLAFVWDSPGWGGGVATVEPAIGEHVWGVLWDLTDEHVRALDEYEGVARGVYVKESTDVKCGDDKIRASIYLATDLRQKLPSARYVTALVRGAVAFALPEEYVERLRELRR